MRSGADRSKLNAFMEAVGNQAQSPGRVYITGGASALLLNVRDQTIDIDIKLDPEPDGVFEAIARLKERLELNVELASPDQFIPSVPGWRQRSKFIAKIGKVEFFHYDFVGQALSKILRGYMADLSDARALIGLGLVGLDDLRSGFESIKPQLIRYPGINQSEFQRKVDAFIVEQVEGP